jgi:Icc-related predicted phosphoesterase
VGSGRLAFVRVRVISDLHGAVDHLRAAGRDSDVLVVLGDLINVVDYRSMDGILARVFGREPVAEAAALRARGRYEEARTTLRRAVGDEREVRDRFAALAREGYERVYEAMPDGAVVTYGNVDIPELLRDLAPSGVRVVDGEVVELAGLRWGIVGGGMRTPLGIPGERSEEEHAGALAALGPVDVVGTHAPPRIPWYCYDTVAERFEPGSDGLLAYIVEHRPRYALFGHVHQPLVDRGTIGPTELVNVGHFRAHGGGWDYEGPD